MSASLRRSVKKVCSEAATQLTPQRPAIIRSEKLWATALKDSWAGLSTQLKPTLGLRCTLVDPLGTAGVLNHPRERATRARVCGPVISPHLRARISACLCKRSPHYEGCAQIPDAQVLPHGAATNLCEACPNFRFLGSEHEWVADGCTPQWWPEPEPPSNLEYHFPSVLLPLPSCSPYVSYPYRF